MWQRREAALQPLGVDRRCAQDARHSRLTSDRTPLFSCASCLVSLRSFAPWLPMQAWAPVSTPAKQFVGTW